ncbi:protein YgfX [Orbus mooreae]|uniref:protein YgfX n=1 Tax=Orbus mooreae TaxID=3074107 RepID=UPI00370D9452
MWRAELINSVKQRYLVTLFYLLLIMALMHNLADTILDDLLFVLIILVIYQWWKGICYLKTIRGELALFYHKNQLYWSRQRWDIVKPPLFFRYAIIIHLISKRNRKKRVLFLMDDSFNCQDWHSLHYFLHHNESLRKNNNQ